jgi:hypothetical protein
MLIKRLMFDQSVKRGVQKASMFKPQAEYIFRRVTKIDPTIAAQAIAEQEGVKQFMSTMMSIGSEMTRNRYTFTGVVIGTVGTLTVLNIIKNKRKA